jgi:hypothetical protein
MREAPLRSYCHDFVEGMILSRCISSRSHMPASTACPWLMGLTLMLYHSNSTFSSLSCQILLTSFHQPQNTLLFLLRCIFHWYSASASETHSCNRVLRFARGSRVMAFSPEWLHRFHRIWHRSRCQKPGPRPRFPETRFA